MNSAGIDGIQRPASPGFTQDTAQAGQAGRAANGERFTVVQGAQSGFDASDVEELAMRLSNRVFQNRKSQVKAGHKGSRPSRQKGVKETTQAEQASAVRKDPADTGARLRALQEKYKDGGTLSDEDRQACADILDELYREKSGQLLAELEPFTTGFGASTIENLRNKYQQSLASNTPIDHDFLKDLSQALTSAGLADNPDVPVHSYRDTPSKMYQHLGEHYGKTPLPLALALEVSRLGSQQGLVKNNETTRLLVNVNELRVARTLSALIEHCETTEQQLDRLYQSQATRNRSAG